MARVQTPWHGLGHFARSVKTEWTDLRTWPHLNVGNDLGPNMLSMGNVDLRDMLIYEIRLPGVKDKHLEMWDCMIERGRLRPKPASRVGSRVLDFLHKAKTQLLWRNIVLFEQEHIALEYHCLQSKMLADKLATKASDVQVPRASRGPTSGAPQMEDRAIRGCCENDCSVSLAMSSVPSHQVVCQKVLEALRTAWKGGQISCAA